MVSEKILLVPSMVRTLSGVLIMVPNSPMVSVEGGKAEQDRERALCPPRDGSNVSLYLLRSESVLSSRQGFTDRCLPAFV